MKFWKDNFLWFCEDCYINLVESASWLKVEEAGIRAVVPDGLRLAPEVRQELGITGNPDDYVLEFPCTLDALETFLEDNGLMDLDVGDVIDRLRAEESPVSEAQKVFSEGVTVQEIAVAFDGLRFDSGHWRKNLASPPVWLLGCRTAEGQRGGASSLWNPVLVALALHGRGIALKSLDKVFSSHMKDLGEAWTEASGGIRYSAD